MSVVSYLPPKCPLQCKRSQRFGHTQRNCGYAPRHVACCGAQLTGGCSNPREQPQCCGCGGNHTASYRGCIKWKEAKAALAKRAPGVRKSAATSQSGAPKAQRAGPFPEQTDLVEGWNHVVRGGVLSRQLSLQRQILNYSSAVTEADSKPKVTATRKKACPKNSKPKSPAATKPTTGKAKKKAVASVKTAAAKPTTLELVVPNQSSTSPLEEISDLLDQLPIQSCEEHTRRLLTSISSLLTGAAHQPAFLKIVIF